MRANSKIIVAPSLLSADFSDPGGMVRQAEEGGADSLHVDIMDGHFVPNLTFGPMMVAALRRLTDLPLDVHLMIQPPEPFLDAFAEAGATGLTLHYESTPHIHLALRQVRERGLQTGLAINPGTPWQVVEPLLEEVDLVLVMTVNPGFGGQAFIPACLRKVRAIRKLCEEQGVSPWIQVDGGVDAETVGQAVQAGANWVVAGSFVYHSPDPAARLREIRRNVMRAVSEE